jgi:hypothetical protein
MNMLRDMITGNDQELVRAKLTDINETIDDTAVDVFVYDTSKDSDGGAWRHRTQHTSWYNEASSASRDPNTRSTRAEFPAVAVIVAESNKVTIYDGDDPSLPMWMVFPFVVQPPTSITSVQILQGKLAIGSDVSISIGLTVYDFPSDSGESWYTLGTNPLLGGIADRPDDLAGWNTIFSASFFGSGLVNAIVNDVAMTVLPDAPTDPATGLPVPTIAVGTAGGVSVIRDDGTVVDLTYTLSANNSAFDVGLDNGGRISWASREALSNGIYLFVENSIPASDKSTAPDIIYTPQNISGGALRYSGNAAPYCTGFTPSAIGTHTGGITHLAENPTTPSEGMVAYTTSSYNTGWLPGDIKLAALADTTAETLSGSELVTNSELTTDTTGWTTSSATFVSSGGRGLLTNTGGYGYAYQAVTTVVGETYVASADYDRDSSSTRGNIAIGTSAGADNLAYDNQTATQTGTVLATFTATDTTTYISVYGDASGSNHVYYDNVSVRLADPDRSVNGNGLAVHGSITKAPVATGADVVAYSGFSSSNYLEQPYNADLDFGAYTGTAGTGDFCVMGWVKTNSTGQQTIISRDLTKLEVYANANGVAFTIGGTGRQGTTPISSNTWRFFVVTRRSGVGYTYVDGALDGSVAATGSVDVSADTFVGIRENLAFPWTGSVALLRISATAPTADQIAKIYEDEKFLFQENAKATLYYDGTSSSPDAVTALAHDPVTDLLHVGTSGGRSVFQGLRRVEEHTGTDSQSLAAISAVDGLVVEGK